MLTFLANLWTAFVAVAPILAFIGITSVVVSLLVGRSIRNGTEVNDCRLCDALDDHYAVIRERERIKALEEAHLRKWEEEMA